jgi:hypothetical protein
MITTSMPRSLWSLLLYNIRSFVSYSTEEHLLGTGRYMLLGTPPSLQIPALRIRRRSGELMGTRLVIMGERQRAARACHSWRPSSQSVLRVIANRFLQTKGAYY